MLTVDAPVSLRGTGMLSDTIASELVRRPVSTNVVVVATDAWDTTSYPSVRRECAEAAVPWLPVRAELGTVVIGPVELPGVPGCGQCFFSRRNRARQESDVDDVAYQVHADVLANRPSAWVTPLAGATVAELVIDELTRFRDSPRAGRTRQAVLYVDLERLTVRRHRFLPDPLCDQCGNLAEDAPDLADLVLQPRPKVGEGTLRIRKVTDELDDLVDTYVDSECGLIRSLHRDTRGGLQVAVATLPLRQNGQIEYGSGRTRSYRTSEMIAVLEAIERWGGALPGGRQAPVVASYADIADSALDPRTMGVHPPESYRLPGFPHREFSEDAVCRWTWGYSFAQQKPILVPQSCVHYRLPTDSAEDRSFFYEISNGCALGSCPEEAILHGLLEIAERDAFLLTWYARIPAPLIDLDGARDRTIPLQAAAISADIGYRILAFDITTEVGVPCAWVMAIGAVNDPAEPKVACAAGAHVGLERAVLNALGELGHSLTELRRRFASEADRARSMVADPSLVVTMPDHSTLYGAYEAATRLDFLTQSPNRRDLAGPAITPSGNANLTADLIELVGRFLAHDLDVIVVDQTTDEHRAGGFSCAKVLVPGTLPMTFGHHRRRVRGLSRLHTVPSLLGHRPSALPDEDVNPHPHPFP